MRNRKSLTDGVGVLGAIYNHLRGQSYRSARLGWAWSWSRHDAYRQGVRDALNEVAAAVGNPARVEGSTVRRKPRRRARGTQLSLLDGLDG